MVAAETSPARTASVAPVRPLAIAEWIAEPTWRSVDLVSDLHLQAAEPATALAWSRYLRGLSQRPADALCILGDLFEVWIGDDLLTTPGDGLQPATVREAAFLRTCRDELHAFSQRAPVFFMHGNRDFLLGQAALKAMGMHGLSDPTVLVFQGQRYLLSHGDAWCLDDHPYQAFRSEVRTQAWQKHFLGQPLAERARQAATMRQQSQSRKQLTAGQPELWADVDTSAARRHLQAAQAHTLIHGHTHRPDRHDLGDGMQRIVLTDWDLGASPARAEVLRLSAAGVQRLPLI